MTNHTDKELLELAARAAGYETKLDRHSAEVRIKSGNIWPCWNPLADDGAALRLAVKLQFDVIPKWGDNCVCIIGGGDHFEEPQQPDIYAAMRRAIVRAAAAIGEKL